MIVLNERLKQILIDFIEDSLLDSYLIYGSLAFSIYTGSVVPISDIDIIVPKKNFKEIIVRLEKNSKYSLFLSEKSLHINLNFLKGNDGKPFDISLDSFEDYFSDLGFSLDDFYEYKINGKNIRIIPKEDLIKIYSIPLGQHNKSKDYEQKVNQLKNSQN